MLGPCLPVRCGESPGAGGRLLRARRALHDPSPPRRKPDTASHRDAPLSPPPPQHCSPSGNADDGEVLADDAMEAAYRVRHTFARTARECPDAKFLLLEVCGGVWGCVKCCVSVCVCICV